MVGFLLSDERDAIQPEQRQETSRAEQALAKLSPPCRAAFDRAGDEARTGGASHIGCDHLLLGLAGTPGAAAGRLLAEISFTVDEIRARLGFVQGPGAAGETDDASPPLSPRTERVVLAAEKDCLKRGLTEIGTLQLLAALIAERDSVAVFILEEPGVGLERLGAAVQRAYREKWEDERVGIRD